MAHIQDRWYRTKKDEKTGKPIKERTVSHGTGMRYKVRYIDPSGDERSKMFPDRQLTAAQAFLHKIEHDKARGTFLDPAGGKIRFRDYAGEWLESQTFDESTRIGTELRLRLHTYPHLGDTALRDIRPSTIRSWDRSLQRAGKAETYRRLIFANVSAILSAAIDDELIAKNPCAAKSVTAPRGKYPKVVPWTDARVHQVREALGERYRIMVTVGAGCGLRQGEVFGLSPDDIDTDAEVIHVRRQIKLLPHKMVFALPKHGKAREVPLPTEVAHAVKRHIEAFPPLPVTLPWKTLDGDPVTVPLLVYTREQNPIYRNSFNHHVWKPALRAAGIPDPKRADGFHALRHFYASVLLDAGESIRALAEYLGHGDPGFTLRTYTHLMPTSAARTRAALDRILRSTSDDSDGDSGTE